MVYGECAVMSHQAQEIVRQRRAKASKHAARALSVTRLFGTCSLSCYRGSWPQDHEAPDEIGGRPAGHLLRATAYGASYPSRPWDGLLAASSSSHGARLKPPCTMWWRPPFTTVVPREGRYSHLYAIQVQVPVRAPATRPVSRGRPKSPLLPAPGH